MTSIYLDTFGVTRYVLKENDTLADVSDTLDNIASEVSSCTKCSLHANRTNTVFGVGNTSPDILIVGEAPGFYEDKQGEPFVGRAGGLLNAMLKSIGLSRDEVYIANVLKCRPDNNRDPKPSEIEACTPYLLRQVKLLSPKIIVALGRHAAHFLLKSNDTLGKMRQKEHRFYDFDIPLVVTYHPAYLLRNPKDKKSSYQDLLGVKKLLNNLKNNKE